jgi:four helix bundle protein
VEVNLKTPEDFGERTFALALRVVRLCQKLHDMPGVPRTISYQLLKSGTSIGANYEESQAAQSRPDFVSKNCIAPKEARETRYWIRLLIAAEILPGPLLADLLDEFGQVAKILGAIVSCSRCNQE